MAYLFLTVVLTLTSVLCKEQVRHFQTLQLLEPVVAAHMRLTRHRTPSHFMQGVTVLGVCLVWDVVVWCDYSAVLFPYHQVRPEGETNVGGHICQ